MLGMLGSSSLYHPPACLVQSSCSSSPFGGGGELSDEQQQQLEGSTDSNEGELLTGKLVSQLIGLDGFLDEAQSGIDLLKHKQQEEAEDEASAAAAAALARGLETVNLLVACAEAVAAKSTSLLHRFLDRLGQLTSPRGETSIERVGAYFAEALACRAAADSPDVYRALPLDLSPSGSLAEGDAAAVQVLNHVSPLVKFAHFTANEAILSGTDGADRVHVIDLDIGTGLQWPPLLQGLATRACGAPSVVRITGVGAARDAIDEAGDRLEQLAASLGLGFEFHAVAAERLDDVRLWMLHVKEGDAVAVNSVCQMHRSLGDEARVKAALDLVRAARPAVVAMVEQESSHNVDDFAHRFPAALRYYAAVFDAIESSELPAGSSGRASVEQGIFAREIRNIVACDGDDFVERHEEFARWGQILSSAGFRSRSLGPRALVQARLLLEMFACKEYRVQETQDGSGITLSWLDQPLLTASAWAPNL